MSLTSMKVVPTLIPSTESVTLPLMIVVPIQGIQIKQNNEDFVCFSIHSNHAYTNHLLYFFYYILEYIPSFFLSTRQEI